MIIGDTYSEVTSPESNANKRFANCVRLALKNCEILCKQCEMYLCTLCTASAKHKQHEVIHLENIYKTKRIDIIKDSTELKRLILTFRTTVTQY